MGTLPTMASARSTRSKKADTDEPTGSSADVLDADGNVVVTLGPGEGVVLQPGWHLEGDDPAADNDEE